MDLRPLAGGSLALSHSRPPAPLPLQTPLAQAQVPRGTLTPQGLREGREQDRELAALDPRGGGRPLEPRTVVTGTLLAQSLGGKQERAQGEVSSFCGRGSHLGSSGVGRTFARGVLAASGRCLGGGYTRVGSGIARGAGVATTGAVPVPAPLIAHALEATGQARDRGEMHVRVGSPMATAGEASGAPDLRVQENEWEQSQGSHLDAAVDAVQRACLLALQVIPGCTLHHGWDAMPPGKPESHAMPSHVKTCDAMPICNL